MYKVYNQNKTEILLDYDLSIGFLTPDTIIHKFPEIIAVKEEGHYETLVEYPNGGRDVKWVVDVPGVKGVPAHEEVENIMVYIPYTEEEILERKQKEEFEQKLSELNENIDRLKKRLADTDYKTLKYIEGFISSEDFEPIKLERQGWRDQINQYENEIYRLKYGDSSDEEDIIIDSSSEEQPSSNEVPEASNVEDDSNQLK